MITLLVHNSNSTALLQCHRNCFGLTGWYLVINKLKQQINCTSFQLFKVISIYCQKMFSFFNIGCPESTFVQHMVNTHFIQGSCEHKSHSTLHYKQVFEFAHDSNNHVYGPLIILFLVSLDMADSTVSF